MADETPPDEALAASAAVETWRSPFPTDHLPPHSEEAEEQKRRNIAQPMTLEQRVARLERLLVPGADD